MIGYINYPTDNRVRREAEALAATGKYQIKVLAPGNVYSDSQLYAREGVQIIELPSGKYQGKSKIRYLWSYLAFMVRSFFYCSRAALDVDVVHIHNMPDFLVFSALLPRLFGKKVILDIHDTMYETYLAKFREKPSRIILGMLRLEEKVSCLFATDIICVNHIQKQLLLDRGVPDSKITITMNVPDPAVFRTEQSPRLPSTARQAANLVYHGTVTERLGIDLVIRAVAQLKDEMPFITFRVFGDGDDLDAFLDLSRELGVEGSVSFNRGFVPMEELIPTLKTMDIGVVANRWNVAADYMLPVKMLEYIILGIPVVTPRLRTIEHYFTDDMVSFFEPEDVESLVESIRSLALDDGKKERQAQNALSFIRKYGWEKHKDDLLALYEKA